jgi:hypothetical protein
LQKFPFIFLVVLTKNRGNNHDTGTVYVIIISWHAQLIIIVRGVIEYISMKGAMMNCLII